LHDRVPAYITWDQYLANQRQLWENQRRPATKGTPGGGSALLTGLLFCGRCGRKMQVDYQSISRARYSCSRRRLTPTDKVCGGMPARRLDEFVTRQILQALSPAAIELSLCAAEQTSQERRQNQTQLGHNLDRATYEAQRAERQYQAVEPENRIVARTLEARWETALEQQCAARDAYDRFQHEKPIELTAAERRSLEELSVDIPALWNAPQTTARERKQIVRCLIERVEIAISAVEQQMDVTFRWAGGFESRHEMRRPVAAYEELDDFEQLLVRLGEMRRAGWRSPRIAAQLNAEGSQTPKQCGGFTDHVVRMLFGRLTSHALEQNGKEPEPPLWSADTLARRLKIPVKKLKDWVRYGWVQVIERPFGGTWILQADERELVRLDRRVALSQPGRNYPADLATARPQKPRATDTLD
jgi:hypothetical protein